MEQHLMTKPLRDGDLAVITKAVKDENGVIEYGEGQEFVIDGYVTAEEAGQEQGYYYGSTLNTGNSGDVEVDEEFVSLKKPASELAARRIPTVSELRGFLGGAMLDEDDKLSITETSPDGENSVEIFGRTTEGLPFVATIQITSISPADF